MNFHIADTFTDGLARLTNEEQKAVKTTAFDLQINPVNPGMQFHKLDRVRDRNFWSVRVSRDIRLIVHKTAASLMLCYVGHHDDAYDWAERRKLEVHPKTGAAQFVVVRETVIEVAIRKAVEQATRKPLLFASYADNDLLRLGVPTDLIAAVKRVDEDSLFELAEHLPAEVAEALLQEATGGVPAEIADDGASIAFRLRTEDPDAALSILDEPTERSDDPVVVALTHPDSQRRFRLIENRDELERALEFPWDKWTTFLHPAQRDVAERNFNGPARVSGSAGTGKTIVALHRAYQLAKKNPDARVLLATLSEPLAQALRVKLRRLVGSEPRLAERIDVHAMDAIAMRLHRAHAGDAALASSQDVAEYVRAARREVADSARFGERFVLAEWSQIVDAFHLQTWEAYRDFSRLGRKTRMSEAQRRTLWAVFEKVRAALRARKAKTQAELYFTLAAALKPKSGPPFEYVVVDEAQDLSPPELAFLAAVGGDRPNALFFAGDIGQQIFQQPFSWKSMGVDVRGRARVLHVNYRTSHQIRAQADRLLDSEVADVDGNVEARKGTVSVFNGPEPLIQTYENESQEIHGLAEWLKSVLADGVEAHEIAVFVRSEAEIDRARRALASVPHKVLDEKVDATSGLVSLCTMHLAKGLEFRAVAVMACDDEVIPLQERIANVGDDADLRDVYESERHLLYVACTRARDRLLVTAVRPQSEFLDDLTQADTRDADHR
jgi:superfamily I DNA/RNA helicase/mRNA-degrading endonuclease RelE of RelBE toxin-antitoxin system